VGRRRRAGGAPGRAVHVSRSIIACVRRRRGWTVRDLHRGSVRGTARIPHACCTADHQPLHRPRHPKTWHARRRRAWAEDPGGYAVAFRAAARGLDVALVEAGPDRWDLPAPWAASRRSRSLHVAEVLGEMHRADVLGLASALRRSRRRQWTHRVPRWRSSPRHAQGPRGARRSQRATVHRGRGRLVAGRRRCVGVEVTGPDGAVTRLDGRHVVIATGSVPRPLPGVEIDGRGRADLGRGDRGSPPRRSGR
jgi:hypothetical protein